MAEDEKRTQDEIEAKRASSEDGASPEEASDETINIDAEVVPEEEEPEPSATAPSGSSKASKLKQPKVIALIIVLIIAVIAAVAGIAYLIIQDIEAKAEVQRRAEEAALIHVEPDMVNEVKVENPVDWAEWQGRNGDVYAWIAYPGTAINHPILQDPANEDRYLRTNIDGEYSLYGELFTQTSNALDWSDNVTVVYGHTFPDTNVMFTDLHYLDEEQFMLDNPYIYIYTPSKVFTYEVISVAETDNTNIMSDGGYDDPVELQAYYDSILNPGWEWAHVKPGVTLDAGKDKIIQLSTCCIPSSKVERYVVTAKLINEQKTL